MCSVMVVLNRLGEHFPESLSSIEHSEHGETEMWATSLIIRR